MAQGPAIYRMDVRVEQGLLDFTDRVAKYLNMNRSDVVRFGIVTLARDYGYPFAAPLEPPPRPGEEAA